MLSSTAPTTERGSDVRDRILADGSAVLKFKCTNHRLPAQSLKGRAPLPQPCHLPSTDT